MSKLHITPHYVKDIDKLKASLSPEEYEIIHNIKEIIKEFKDEAAWFDKRQPLDSKYIYYFFLFPFTFHNATMWAASGQNYVHDFSASSDPEKWKNSTRKNLWYKCQDSKLDKKISEKRGLLIGYTIDEKRDPHLLSIVREDNKDTVF